MGTSVAMIDRTYGHLARDSEQAIRARLDARAERSGVEARMKRGTVKHRNRHGYRRTS